MTLNQAMPRFDVQAKHEILINAPATDVYSVLKTTNLSRSFIIRALLWLRSAGNAPKRLCLQQFWERDFLLLEDRPNQEIILGLVGRFWIPRPDLIRIPPADFASYSNPRYGKVGFNFAITTQGSQTLLTTQTRILCTSPQTRRLFRLYWTVVGPFSGLIRKEMLRLIKADAERLSLLQ